MISFLIDLKVRLDRREREEDPLELAYLLVTSWKLLS